MELSVIERLLLLSLLPREGDITTVRIVADVRHDLSFSEDEYATLGMRIENGSAHWKTDREVPRVFTLGPKATAMIVDSLEKLNTSGKLTEQHLSLCEKFGIGT